MFRDEGKIAGRMAHPGVVRVHEVGEADGRHYIAMERVDGYNLAQIIAAHRQANKRFPAAAVFAVLRQVLGALAYVHGFADKRGRPIGIVHRDISPQNILVGRDERVRIADFGIARGGHRADKTRTGTVKGKLHYMAPEQARGHRVDARADLYALGAVAYELWTRQPLHGAEKTEVLHKRAASGAIDFDRPEFRKLNKSVRTWLRTALHPDPEQRFQTAIDMIGAMENVSGASKARFKPGTLTRVMAVADSFDADAARRGPQYLFGDEEMARTTRKSEKRRTREPTPQRPMSGVFLGVSAVSRRDVKPSRRLTATHGAPNDWESELPPPPVARSRRRASQRDKALPVQPELVRSGAFRRPRRASQTISDPDVGDAAARLSAVVAGQRAGLDAEQAAALADHAVRRRLGSVSVSKSQVKRAKPDKQRARKRSRSAEKPENKASQRKSIIGKRAASAARLEKREVVQQQRSLAAASFVMWSAVAMLLFAMVLEAWNARVDFPRVDEQTFAAWFTDAPQHHAASAEKSAPDKSPQAQAKRRAPKPARPVDVRNDRFLPRQAIGAMQREKPAASRVATAPTGG